MLKGHKWHLNRLTSEQNQAIFCSRCGKVINRTAGVWEWCRGSWKKQDVCGPRSFASPPSIKAVRPSYFSVCISSSIKSVPVVVSDSLHQLLFCHLQPKAPRNSSSYRNTKADIIMHFSQFALAVFAMVSGTFASPTALDVSNADSVAAENCRVGFNYCGWYLQDALRESPYPQHHDNQY